MPDNRLTILTSTLTRSARSRVTVRPYIVAWRRAMPACPPCLQSDGLQSDTGREAESTAAPRYADFRTFRKLNVRQIGVSLNCPSFVYPQIDDVKPDLNVDRHRKRIRPPKILDCIDRKAETRVSEPLLTQRSTSKTAKLSTMWKKP